MNPNPKSNDPEAQINESFRPAAKTNAERLRKHRERISEEIKNYARQKNLEHQQKHMQEMSDEAKENARQIYSSHHVSKRRENKNNEARIMRQMHLKLKDNLDYFPSKEEIDVGIKLNDIFIARLLFHENSWHWQPIMFLGPKERDLYR